MKVFVEHIGTSATKAHNVGVLTLAECERKFAGMNERGWTTLDRAWLLQLCQEGGALRLPLLHPDPESVAVMGALAPIRVRFVPSSRAAC